MDNRRFKKSKKNGGVIPPILDERTRYVSVGCQRCMECRKQKSRDWNVRLQEEIRGQKLKGHFMTMTFSPESVVELVEALKKEKGGCDLEGYELDDEIVRIGIRRFLERWRKKYKKSLRHWLVTEIGGNGTERMHIHGIIWTDESEQELKEKWRYGLCDIGKKGVSGKSASYIVKYMYKTDEKHREYKGKVFTSAGIGSSYMQRMDSKR